MFFAVLACACAYSCMNTKELDTRLDTLEQRVEALNTAVADINSNTIALRSILRDETLILGFKQTENGYQLELSDGGVIIITMGDKIPGIVPIISIDQEGNWIMSTDNGETFSIIEGSSNALDINGITPEVKVDEEGYWIISTDGGDSWNRIYNSFNKPISAVDGASVSGASSVFANVEYDADSSTVTFTLQNDTKVTIPVLDNFYLKIIGWKDGTQIRSGWDVRYMVEISDVASTAIIAPEGWQVRLTDQQIEIVAPLISEKGEAVISIIVVSSKGYTKTVNMKFDLNPKATVETGVKLWDDFANESADNILLDYSYAGYKHGETEPEDISTLGYTVYDITEYGAVADDGKSDRAAFKKVLDAIFSGASSKPDARAIIYFPEGEFILHTSDDDVDGVTETLFIRGGNIVIKGAGRDKTTILMQDPALPSDPSVLYSSPAMLEVKHMAGLSDITKVTADAAKGTFSVECASTSGITSGEFVCLCVENNQAEYIAKELAPYNVEAGMLDLLNNGVKVYDYHQVKAVNGNKVEFYEPIMHQVEAAYNWRICKYPHYENIGVEDICFRGNAKNDFIHHGSWQDDGAYKPLNFTRVANAWVRRCRFTSVSEAFTITNSANVSVYDIIVDGERGHSAVRAQGASRVFIGAVKETSGHGAGQYHACGVSKPALGTVLWRNSWGDDSCFEAHATQPRATLVDCCKGGWMQYRQGGDANQVPNHLNDLTIWNMESTTPFTGTWNWYENGKYWKFVMPIIVGFHGEMCVMNPAQCKVDYSHGKAVEVESLYEAQLRLRLGYVPAWINSLK